MAKKSGKWIPFVIGLCAGSAVTSALFKISAKPKIGSAFEEVHLGQREFVNPLVDCEGQAPGMPPSKAALVARIEEQIGEFKRQKKADLISVLYRDLNNGPGLGIQTKEPFIAASLLKTPIMIAFFKRLDVDPQLFQIGVKYDSAVNETIVPVPMIRSPRPPMVHGEIYPVADLLTRMILDSDNSAVALLLKHFPEVDALQTLNEMGIPVVQKGDDIWITVEDYASIFRILYNSTYLGPERSNAALAMLSSAQFEDGLRAGVDKGIPVAHKFGERTIAGRNQFHDCGIIYYPTRPYLLCIMTRGTHQKDLVEVTASLSKTFFEQVKKDAEVH